MHFNSVATKKKKIDLTKSRGKGTTIMFWDVIVKDSLEMKKEADLQIERGLVSWKKNCSKSHLIQKQSDEIQV